MTKVIYAPAAEFELVEIGGYIALDSERNAEAFVTKLREKATRIALNPRIYRMRDDLSPGLRSAALGNYLILFRIVAGGIEVARIVHGARDLPRLFEK
ncbi:MAG: type II toxin-antitoxin system RelE/ParE family toxin [Rhizomicrobium sp.]